MMFWLALQPQPEPVADATATRDSQPAAARAGRLADASDAAGPDAPLDGTGAAAVAVELVDAAAALAWWALRFTPRVHLQAPVVLLEVSASERLFGGRRQLVEGLLATDRPVARLRWAQADTALLALARLQVGAPANRPADQLPLHTLAAAGPHLATLERLGCRTWGDLRALPRGGVVRRFGAPLLDALDRAYGLMPEVYPWLVLPEVFDQPLELLAQVEAASALVFAARRLLAQLQVWLQARQRGVLALELCWQMDPRRDTATQGSLVVRTATPTLDMAHLQRLLAENLARIRLPAPVLHLRLRSLETVALSGASASLLLDEGCHGDDLLQLLERLSARLGAQQVLRVEPRADHRPERMQQWLPASGGSPMPWAVGGGLEPGRVASACAYAGPGGGGGSGSGGGGGGGGNASAGGNGGRRRSPGMPASASDALYPPWLLVTPLRLAVRQDRPLYQGPLTLLVGPQRLEAAWWDVSAPAAAQPGCMARPDAHGASAALAQPATAASDAAPSSQLALRDYFLARSEQAGLLWIYRERLAAGRHPGDTSQGHWYLHGVFG